MNAVIQRSMESIVTAMLFAWIMTRPPDSAAVVDPDSLILVRRSIDFRDEDVLRQLTNAWSLNSTTVQVN
jgi:hypothetical protein